MSWIEGMFRGLRERTGLNFTIFYDPFDISRFLDGLWTTVTLFLISAAISIAIGLVGVACLTLPNRLANAIARAYVAAFRNTPPLIQIYFLYFAIGGLMPGKTNQFGLAEPLIGNFAWALIGLSLYAGAFNIEIFRAGVEAIHASLVEATAVLGYSRFAAFVHVLVPLAWRISLPALCNNMIELLKTTTLAYAIGVPELLYVSNQIWSDSLNTFEMMNVLMVVYLLLVGIVAWVMHRWERALRLRGFGTTA